MMTSYKNSKKITMKVAAEVVAELKPLVPPGKDYSHTIKMLIDSYNNLNDPPKGPSANKFRG